MLLRKVYFIIKLSLNVRMKGLIMDLKESCPKTYEDLFTFSFPDGWVLPWLMAQRNKAIIGKVLSVFPICMLKLSITTMWNCHKYIFLLICWVNLPWWGHILFIDAVLESCSLAFHPPSSCFCTEDGSEFPSACFFWNLKLLTLNPKLDLAKLYWHKQSRWLKRGCLCV